MIMFKFYLYSDEMMNRTLTDKFYYLNKNRCDIANFRDKDNMG